jgi:2-polyprenyl-3-methyl-5-hydroxy-6-metoxy-1,4-benzoquinol methylase
MYAAKVGNDVVGISFDARNNDVARRRAEILGISGVDFIQGDLRKLDEMQPRLGSFDQIICQETIEHIRNDSKLVNDLASLLKPDGRLYLTTPSLGHRPVYGELEQHTWSEDGGHVRYGYSHEQLAEMFHSAGLEVIDRSFVSGALSQWIFSLTGWLAISLHLPLRLAWGLTFPLRVLQAVDRPFTRLIHYPFFSVAVVARRSAEDSAQTR